MTLSGLAMAERWPLDFTIQYPPRREYFQQHFRQPAEPRQIALQPQWLLYVHVPFCAAKCYYCNFSVDVRRDSQLRKRYVEGLLRQIERLGETVSPEQTLRGIDIGGGTPTLLETELLTELLKALRPWRKLVDHPFPLSIESTPSIAAEHPEKLTALAEGGVDRISIGLQSTNEETLQQVNRSLQRGVNERAMLHLRQAGFRRVHCDLIFGLPEQTDDHWRTDLERVVALAPDSITTYDCLYRGKGRVLTKRTPETPSPEDYQRLYDLAWNFLTERGYHACYGGLNFSRRAEETGTSAYFEGRLLDGLPYLGLGNYASSWARPYWWFAPYGVDAWLKRLEQQDWFPAGDSYELPEREWMAKYLLLSLNYGVLDAERFGNVFACDFEETFAAELRYAVEHGWLRQAGRTWRVAEGQFANMYAIRSLFYTREAEQWLEQALRLNDE